MLLIYILGCLVVLQGIVSLLDGFKSARHMRRYQPVSRWSPRVVVFCPCRGIDQEFRKNIASILEQDYRNFEAVFVVDSIEDPAYRELQEMGVNTVVAGFAVDCGQKVHNLIYAMDRAPACDVYVFCDSDARYPMEWLRNLIAPLEDAGLGASTGYRWYFAGARFPSLLRSVWNASVVTQLGDHARNFAWGGSMAVRREVFEDIHVRKFWMGSISDDYGVTRAVRASGRQIAFVPSCLIPSYGECSWRELLEFTTRQILIVRVYDPRTWRMAAIAQFLYTFCFWTLFVLMWTRPFAAALWLILVGLSMGKAFIRMNAVTSVLPDRALSKDRWSYILLAPFIAVLYAYNIFRSALTRQMVWRQIHYTLASPNRVVVRRGASES